MLHVADSSHSVRLNTVWWGTVGRYWEVSSAPPSTE